MAVLGTVNNTIALSTGPTNATKFEEIPVMTTVYPGMICMEGGLGVIPYNLPGGNAERLIAVENPYQGRGIYDSYTTGDLVMLRLAQPGDVFLIKVTSIVVADLYSGMPMTPDGAGWVKQVDLPDQDIFGRSIDVEETPTLPRWTRIRIG